MRMEKRQFRIGELSKQVGVERFVIRFWEKEFNIKPHRSDGGQRFYREDDLHTFQEIKTLLYDHGFTIAGAKQQINVKGSTKPFMTSAKTIMDSPKKMPEKMRKQLLTLRKQLLALHDLL